MPTPDRIDKAEKVLAELRETIQEANGVRNDLMHVMKEWKEYLDNRIDERIDPMITKALDELSEATHGAIKRAERHTMDYFVELMKDTRRSLEKQIRREIGRDRIDRLIEPPNLANIEIEIIGTNVEIRE